MTDQDPAAGSLAGSEKVLGERTLLVISPDFPAQDNRYMGSLFVKNQLESLKHHFKHVIVIVPVLFSGGILPNDRYCHDYSYDNISVYYPRCFFFPRSVSLPLIKNSQKFSFDTRLSAVQNLIEKKHLQFDLIHAHFTWPSTYIATRLKEQYHIPVAATIHEDSGWLKEEIQDANQSLVDSWRNADALIRVNRQEIPLLKQYNDAVFFVPNGFSPLFKPMDTRTCRLQLQVSLEKPVLFSVGDLIPRKGFSYLIDALTIVRRQYPNIICYIGGHGPEEKNLRRQIRDNHLEDRVILLGSIPEDILPLWMNCADLYALPSLQESFGIVQIEALACGKPVIAARNAGSREIVVSDDIGVLCDPHDSDSLACALVQGLSRKWDHQKILAYSEKYSWEMVVKSILPIYIRIIRNNRTHDPP